MNACTPAHTAASAERDNPTPRDCPACYPAIPALSRSFTNEHVFCSRVSGIVRRDSGMRDSGTHPYKGVSLPVPGCASRTTPNDDGANASTRRGE
jgi:hypothetical protein